jgi:hypothetical protein
MFLYIRSNALIYIYIYIYIYIHAKFIIPLQDDMPSNYRKCMSLNLYYSIQVGEDYLTIPTAIGRKICDSLHCLVCKFVHHI